MSESLDKPPQPRRYSAIGQIILVQIREFTREPEAIFWVYVFPIMMILALGIAFREQRVEPVQVDVIADDQAQAISTVLGDHEQINVAVYERSEAFNRLRTGKSELVVQTTNPDIPAYEYHFDPTKPGSLLARDVVDNVLQRTAGRIDPAEATSVEHTEPGGRYIDFLIPGLLGMGLMGSGLWGLGAVIVDMRLRNVLKQLMATPMKRSHFLGGLMISRLLGIIPEVLILLIASRLMFGVVNHGSAVTVVFLITLGGVMFAGIGVLTASRARTLEAVSGLISVVMLPMWVMSGIFFSSERFPDVVQPVIRLLPLTPLIDSLRSVMLDGATLTTLIPEITTMVAWTVVSFTIALRIFRWL